MNRASVEDGIGLGDVTSADRRVERFASGVDVRDDDQISRRERLAELAEQRLGSRVEVRLEEHDDPSRRGDSAPPTMSR